MNFAVTKKEGEKYLKATLLIYLVAFISGIIQGMLVTYQHLYWFVRSFALIEHFFSGIIILSIVYWIFKHQTLKELIIFNRKEKLLDDFMRLSYGHIKLFLMVYLHAVYFGFINVTFIWKFNQPFIFVILLIIGVGVFTHFSQKITTQIIDSDKTMESISELMR